MRNSRSAANPHRPGRRSLALTRSLVAWLVLPLIPAGAATYDQQARVIAGMLRPLGLTPKPDPKGLSLAAAQIAAVLSELGKSAAANGPGTHTLLKTAYEKFRPDVGPAHRTAAIIALEAMWDEARALGAFGAANQYTGKITRGADAGADVVLEYIVPLELDPRFSRDLANIRLVAPGRARAKDAPPTAREVANARNLDAIAREIEGRKSLEKIARSVPTDAAGLTREEAARRWKTEFEGNGDAAKARPSIVLRGMMTATPSKRSGYKWRVEAELVNLSPHATEVELQCFVIGTTWKNRENYLMLDRRQQVRLRSAQRDTVVIETLEERVYKSRGDLYEKLTKPEIGRSEASYRGVVWRVVHPQGECATFATDDALLKMLDKDSDRNIENMAKLYLDPKEWPPSPTEAGAN